MVYKYLLVQIHFSDLFLSVGFIYFIIFLKKKPHGLFLWIGFSCLKTTEPLREGTLLFTTKLPSTLSFSKSLLGTIFQFSCIDSKFWCDVLHDLVPFVQFKECKKDSWGSVTFGLLKVTHLHRCFSNFKNCTNGTKLRKTSLSWLWIEHRCFKEVWGMHLHKI